MGKIVIWLREIKSRTEDMTQYHEDVGLGPRINKEAGIPLPIWEEVNGGETGKIDPQS